jgi:hypothetical protein
MFYAPEAFFIKGLTTIVTPLMKKTSGAKHIECNSPCTLAVNNTFEHEVNYY